MLNELHAEVKERRQEVNDLRAQLRQTHSGHGAQHEQRWREEVELHGGVRAQRLVAEGRRGRGREETATQSAGG